MLRLALIVLILHANYEPQHWLRFIAVLLLLTTYGYVEFVRGYNGAIAEFDAEDDQDDTEVS